MTNKSNLSSRAHSTNYALFQILEIKNPKAKFFYQTSTRSMKCATKPNAPFFQIADIRCQTKFQKKISCISTIYPIIINTVSSSLGKLCVPYVFQLLLLILMPAAILIYNKHGIGILSNIIN